MTTTQEAVEAIAGESPSAAGLVAAIMDHSARERESMMPTWDQLWEAEAKAEARGYAAGIRTERDRIYARIFGGWEGED